MTPHERATVARLVARLEALEQAEAERDALRAAVGRAVVEIDQDVAFGICVVGHKGKDVAVRRIGRRVDKLRAALALAGGGVDGEGR